MRVAVSSEKVEGESLRRTRPSLHRYVISYAATLFFLITLNFLLPRAMPGSPLTALEGRSTPTNIPDQATRAALARYYGLNRPLAVQYIQYLADLGHGNLGISTSDGIPVAGLIGERLPWTLLLLGTGLALATTAGLIAGIQSAWLRGRGVDRGLLGFFLALNNFPTFFLAALAVLVFAVRLRWFPLSGANTPFTTFSPFHQVIDIADHLVLPACVLAVQSVAGIYLMMRGSMVSELGSDYLLLGRAKGLRERRLKYHYAARNALLPVVTVIALQVGFIVTGDIFVETVFAYPGMGSLIFDAVGSRDYPTLQGCFLVLTVLVVTVNFLTDMLYARLDPRTAG